MSAKTVRMLPTQEARGGSRPGLLLPAAAAAALLLACAPMSVLFVGGSWLVVSALSVIAVCATGGLLRALPVPLVVVPLAQSAAFVLLLTWWLVEDSTSAGPWESLMGFRDLVGQGVVSVRESVAPVEATPQTLALLAVLVFLCALLVETMAVGLGLAGFSGVVLLILAAVPLGIRPSGQSLLLLVGPAAGWVLLIAADQAVRLHPLRSGRLEGKGWLATAALAVAGIAGAGLLVLTIAPAGETPWLRSYWNGFTSTSTGTSGGDSLDPLVDIRSQLSNRSGEQLLQYRTSDGSPAYLRMVTLEVFDGAAWVPYPLAPSVPLSRPSPSTTVRVPNGPGVDVAVTTLGNPYLPIPDRAVTVSLPEDGDWGWDPRTGDVVSAGASASGLGYSITTAGGTPTPQALALATSQSPQVSRATRAVPPTLPVAVADLAAEVTAGASTNYDRAVALQTWFTSKGGFSYSLDVPDPAGRDPLLAFLEDRRGFCQQFATAMAVMARTQGIPSRVVVGFTGGSPQPDGGFRVSGADAHAWPELWFDQIGWVRFEPTPSAPSTAVTPPDYSPASPSAAPSEPTAQPPAPSAAPEPSANTEIRPGSTTGSGVVWLVGGLVTVAGLLALAAPSALRSRRRRSRLRLALATGDSAVEWREIRDTAVDAGITWPIGATMRQQADAVVVTLDHGAAGTQAVQAVRRLVASAEDAFYSPAGIGAPIARSAASVVVDEPMVTTSADSDDLRTVLAALDGVPRSRWERIVPRSVRSRR